MRVLGNMVGGIDVDLGWSCDGRLYYEGVLRRDLEEQEHAIVQSRYGSLDKLFSHANAFELFLTLVWES